MFTLRYLLKLNNNNCKSVINKYISRSLSYYNHILLNHHDQHYKVSSLQCKQHSFQLFRHESSFDDEIDELLEEDIEREKEEEIFPRNWRVGTQGHNVFIILPRQKWGRNFMSREEAELMMAESVTLIKTLPGWNVVDTQIASTLGLRSKGVFGEGALAKWSQEVRTNKYYSAVFFVIDILSGMQQHELEKHFNVPVYDRYSIILQIFQDHAHTKEAKLQLALAEIPYIKSNLEVVQLSGKPTQSSLMKHVGGPGETWLETRNMLLNRRAVKIKKLLAKLEKTREINRENRKKKELPVVAVVGYTNCGKTSLIRALTGDQRLVPKDILFATLDVTVHAGRLDTISKVLYTDTIGFISYIPTTLIHSFNATLRDITLADLIIHISDASHPNYIAQKNTVLNTLKQINVSEKLMSTMIDVANKIDKVDEKDVSNFQSDNHLLISATKGTNLNELKQEVETRLLSNTDRDVKIFRVPNGGKAYQWLNKECGIKSCEADPQDFNYLIMKVNITNSAYYKFKHHFTNDCTELVQV